MKYYHFKDERRSLCQKCFADPEVTKTSDNFKINRNDYKELELGQRESFLCHGPSCNHGFRSSERHSIGTCDGCKHFNNNGKREGMCALHAPVVSSKDQSPWPKVKWSDWCSHWQRL